MNVNDFNVFYLLVKYKIEEFISIRNFYCHTIYNGYLNNLDKCEFGWTIVQGLEIDTIHANCLVVSYAYLFSDEKKASIEPLKWLMPKKMNINVF